MSSISDTRKPNILGVSTLKGNNAQYVGRSLRWSSRPRLCLYEFACTHIVGAHLFIHVGSLLQEVARSLRPSKLVPSDRMWPPKTSQNGLMLPMRAMTVFFVWAAIAMPASSSTLEWVCP